MRNTAPKDAAEVEALETREWLDSLDYVLQSGGPVKVQRLLKHMLSAEPELPIEHIAVQGAAGCSDFTGTVEAQTQSGTHVFDFAWCCRWRAQQQGWTDFFGFPAASARNPMVREQAATPSSARLRSAGTRVRRTVA